MPLIRLDQIRGRFMRKRVRERLGQLSPVRLGRARSGFSRAIPVLSVFASGVEVWR